MPAFEDSLREALSLDLPYSHRPNLAKSRPAAVLALFGTDLPAGRISLLLTRRTETLDHHRGQMAFPGGAHEMLADGAHEDAVTAALRETHEEVGVPPDAVRVLGTLPTLVTPTGFEIHPVVGMLKWPISDVPLRPSKEEIAEALWIPLSTLLSAEIYSMEQFEAGPIRYTNHVFQVGPHRIWGATGAMIRNLLDRLAQPGRAAP